MKGNLEKTQFKERYQFVENLGEGSQGTVEKCLDKVSNELVAVKKLKGGSEINCEFEINSRLDHPFILKPRDSNTEIKKGKCILKIVYPLMDMSLEDLIKEFKNQKKVFPTDIAFELIFNMINVMAYLEKQKFAHRDIKPQNILVKAGKNSKEFNFFLSDFGCSKEVYQTTYRNTLAGTPNYLAPEVLDFVLSGADEVNCNPFKCDIFSLGFVFLKILSPKEIKGLNTGQNNEKLQSIKNEIKFPFLRSLLEKMLKPTSKERAFPFEIQAFMEKELNKTIRTMVIDYTSSGIVSFEMEISQKQTVGEIFDIVRKRLALKNLNFSLMLSDPKSKFQRKWAWRNFKNRVVLYSIPETCKFYLIPLCNEIRYKIITSYFYQEEEIELDEVEEKFRNIIEKTLEYSEKFEAEICYDSDCFCAVTPAVRYTDDLSTLIIGKQKSFFSPDKFLVIIDGWTMKPLKFMQKYLRPLIQELKSKFPEEIKKADQILKKVNDSKYVFLFGQEALGLIFYDHLEQAIKDLWPKIEMTDWGYVREVFLSEAKFYQSVKEQILES